MIYTAHYNAPISQRPGKQICISVKKPAGKKVDLSLTSFMPTWSLVRAFKDGVYDWNEYTRQYLTLLDFRRRNNAAQYAADILTLNTYQRAGEDVTLLCFCRNVNFCHRRLLANWLMSEHEMKVIVR